MDHVVAAPAIVQPSTPTPVTSIDDYERILERRRTFKTRHASGLTKLMEQREDLRGVHALADLVDDAIRWTA